jgi:hypothetical protein
LNSEPRVATATNDGGANLPVCPNLTDSKFSDAGGTWGYARTSLCSSLVVRGPHQRAVIRTESFSRRVKEKLG